jgi:hypothetical protein
VEGLLNFCPLLDYAAATVEPGGFCLVDIGCSGGIDRQWRRWRRGLRALGIDPDVAEIERLRAQEKHPGISYLDAFARLPVDHPFAIAKRGKEDLARNPWPRLSTRRYMDLVYPKKELVSEKEKRSANLWEGARLADKSVIVPDYLHDLGLRSLDWLKVDVDGRDFDVLHSFDRALAEMGVLGVGIEVRYWGSHEDTDGTFHNIDRFLKERGFELFNLSIRRYSTNALPSRFAQPAPGATAMGRVHQGDAMYARDLGSGFNEPFAKSLSAGKILNLVVIFAIFDLADCAAEVVQKFRSELSTRWDVERMLDLLAMQSKRRLFATKGSYRRYLDKFEQHPRGFLGTKNPFTRFGPALREGFLKWRGRMQLLRIEREG